MKKISNLMKVKALAFISMGVVPFLGFSVGSDLEEETVNQPLTIDNSLKQDLFEEKGKEFLIKLYLMRPEVSNIDSQNEDLSNKSYKEIVKKAEEIGIDTDRIEKIIKISLGYEVELEIINDIKYK